MPLRDLTFQEDYRSGYDNLVGDFYRPSLTESTNYWRAVGYFSSSALESFGAPLGDFVKKGGHIRLVTSVELSEQDLRAIEKGDSKQAICDARVESIVDEQFSEGVGDGVARLCALLEMKRLEILIAVPKKGSGIYHEKIGLFFDGDDFVAFTGSSNESRNAFENNRECIDVYPSWQSPSRAKRKRQHFEALWARQDEGVDVYAFSDAAQKNLLRICRKTRPEPRSKAPEDRKWRHQGEAVALFLKAERGILNMATGTGKTRTALKIVISLFESGQIDTVIVSTDGIDLLQQWHSELLSCRRQIPVPVNVFQDFGVHKEVQDFSLSPRRAMLLVSRRGGVSRDPLVSAMHALSPEQAGRTLLIHDEVHKLGSPSSRVRLAGLSDNIRYRLGLSATPDRDYDAEGNQFIENHIGKELMRFELSDAIRRGILAPFNYFPIHYELTAEDRERLKSVYKRRAARQSAGEPMSEEEVWIQIARVYKTSRAKLPLFAEFIAGNSHLLARCIVFVETQDYGDEVLEIVHQHRADFHTYFSGEQSVTLQRFARGELECLITCHRVSEGIDIQSLNTVILFSSARSRLETIQRMGRCLRSDPNNPDKMANIVDFIRRSDGDAAEPNADEDRRDWLLELSEIRVSE